MPKYRGAAPIDNAILNGILKTGVTIMHMDDGLDTGDIIDVETIEILPNETTENSLSVLQHWAGTTINPVLETLGSWRDYCYTTDILRHLIRAKLQRTWDSLIGIVQL